MQGWARLVTATVKLCFPDDDKLRKLPAIIYAWTLKVSGRFRLRDYLDLRFGLSSDLTTSTMFLVCLLGRASTFHVILSQISNFSHIVLI